MIDKIQIADLAGKAASVATKASITGGFFTGLFAGSTNLQIASFILSAIVGGFAVLFGIINVRVNLRRHNREEDECRQCMQDKRSKK